LSGSPETASGIRAGDPTHHIVSSNRYGGSVGAIGDALACRRF